MRRPFYLFVLLFSLLFVAPAKAQRDSVVYVMADTIASYPLWLTLYDNHTYTYWAMIDFSCWAIINDHGTWRTNGDSLELTNSIWSDFFKTDSTNSYNPKSYGQLSGNRLIFESQHPSSADTLMTMERNMFLWRRE